jgi:L-cysteine desulfidase
MIIKDSSKSVSIPRINIKEFNKFIEEIVGVDSVKEIAENATTNSNVSELDELCSGKSRLRRTKTKE